jgi:hypothetical protein
VRHYRLALAADPGYNDARDNLQRLEPGESGPARG